MPPVARQRADGLWEMRCSPDCPYEDCILLTKIPPMPPQQGGGEGESDDTDSDLSDTDDSDDSSDNESGESSSEDESSNQGDGRADDEESSGSSDGADGGADGNDQKQQNDSKPSDRDSKKPTSNSSEQKPAAKKPEGGGSQGGEGPSKEKPKPITVQEAKKRPVEYNPIFDLSKPLTEGGWGASGTQSADPKKVKTDIKYPVMTDQTFQAKLKNVMTDNAFDRRVRGRKRGKLDMKSLYKVPMRAENVFTLKEARKNKHYNIILLVDESGSMGGNKSKTAAECAVFLAKSFEKMNVNVAIIGFNQFITTRKTFESVADYDDIYEAIKTMNHTQGYGDNNDWDALNKAYQMFKTAPEGKNILIMMSDGQPAQSSPKFIDINGKKEKAPAGTSSLSNAQKEDKRHLHRLVKSNDRTVSSIGIGIMAGGWQIPNHRVVRNVSQLKPVLIKELQQRIQRG